MKLNGVRICVAQKKVFNFKKSVRNPFLQFLTNMRTVKRTYHVYIMTNKHHSTLYVGMTGRGMQRILQHIRKEKSGFTKKYNLDKLVYYEEYTEVIDAINREKQIKRWSRKKKERLIEIKNPKWKNLILIA